MLGTLLQDNHLTSGLDTEERDIRLKELGVTIFAGEHKQGVRWTFY